MQFKWDESFSTGHTEIDQQHQKIFAYLHELELHTQQEFSEQWAATFLDDLNAYIKNHFFFEEMIMRKKECPTAQKNKQQHKKLLHLIETKKSILTQSGYNAEELDRLRLFLGNWFTHHILSIDIKLRDCI